MRVSECGSESVVAEAHTAIKRFIASILSLSESESSIFLISSNFMVLTSNEAPNLKDSTAVLMLFMLSSSFETFV